MKKLSILGSTGSIGTQTLEVCRNIPGFEIEAITANSSIDVLEKQALEFKPKLVSVMNAEKADELKTRLRKAAPNIKVMSGMEGLIEAAVLKESGTIVVSVVGNIGIKPTYEAIKAGKEIALATKEVMVSGGSLITKEAEKHNVQILPIDSEHSAIFQSLQGNNMNKIRKIILTASGGPFRGRKKSELENVTVSQALKHPNWNMGAKITIDSASMMNKGLEVIEAKWLFNIDVNKIEVVVHPQSILHSAVEYEDGAVIGQMGVPDMKVPISYALTYPNRIKNNFEKLDLFKIGTLTFEKPDIDTFECLSLAYEAIKKGGTMPAVLNAANEIAVAKFLNGNCRFTDIPVIIRETMAAYTVKDKYTIDELLEADKWGRDFASKINM
ncbi:MAG: 1-deoxy-D-xylulose-5-phosphate reductoisomerase [Clostridia bacterium]|jgi:1-deoxy-D-xylulose-5-phosphate reductoisomerase|nr:1-deoxy-D-xylulose-5-phosphate reductoisomerase [Clostridia bacterium]MCI2000185.1 1-deoxy-D-xylulose-5-phosphate reductoisomerase [Clostridia bacterium]MCI2014650.1 1-deoxy-D-xylulose-5-phosphate reductoisomerase [Clostridia bacterium]